MSKQPIELKMTNEELDEYNNALLMLAQYEHDILVCFVIRELAETLRPHVSVLRETIEALLQQCAEKGEDGKPIVLGLAQDQKTLVYRVGKDKTGQHALGKSEILKERVVVRIQRPLRASLLLKNQQKEGVPMLAQIFIKLGPLLDMDVDLEAALSADEPKEEKGSGEKS